MKSNFFLVFFKKVEDIVIFSASRAGFFLKMPVRLGMQIAFGVLLGISSRTPQNRTYQSWILTVTDPTTLNPY